MEKNIIERGRLQMIIWCLRIACWVIKATKTHSQYAILIVFPLQQLLHKRASVLRYTCIACLVTGSHNSTLCSSHFRQKSSAVSLLCSFDVIDIGSVKISYKIYIIQLYTTLYFISLYYVIIPATCFGPIVGASSG